MKTTTIIGITAAVILWAATLAVCFGASSPVPPGMTPVKASIDGPERIDAYKIVEMKVSGQWEAGGWRIRDVTVGRSPLNADKRVIDALGTCLWTAPPGSYDCEATLVNFTAKQFFQSAKIVTVEGEGPNPNPQPSPQPQPQPTPGKLWGCLIIEESANRTPAQAAVYTSQSVRKLLQSKGLEFRLVDKDVASPANLASWAARAGTDLPKLFIVPMNPENGKPLPYEGKLPADEKAMLDLIGRVAK